jgi:hypothetical protein
MSCVLALLIKLWQYSPWRSGAASQSSRLQVSHTPVSAWNKRSSHVSRERCLAVAPISTLHHHLTTPACSISWTRVPYTWNGSDRMYKIQDTWHLYRARAAKWERLGFRSRQKKLLVFATSTGPRLGPTSPQYIYCNYYSYLPYSPTDIRIRTTLK